MFKFIELSVSESEASTGPYFGACWSCVHSRLRELVVQFQLPNLLMTRRCYTVMLRSILTSLMGNSDD